MSGSSRLTTVERIVALAATLLLAVGVVAAIAKPLDPVPLDGSPPPAPPPANPDPSQPRAAVVEGVGVVTTHRPAAIFAEPRLDAPEVSFLRPGIVLPVTEERDGFFAVLTPCEVGGWVWGEDVQVHPPAVPDMPREMNLVTILLDPGHGGVNPGATGPGGLTEKEVNLDIVRRLRDLLGETRVLLTLDADHTAGLRYRTEIASRIQAHAFLSVHNNAEPDGPSPRPGTETYYQHRSAESRRLAGLAYEELVRTFEPYPVPWVADRDAGAKVRISSRGDDYYAILRGTDRTAVLVEGLFISNAPEEALLADPAFRQRYAEALHRAIVQFVTTDDPGSGFIDPYPRGSGPSGGLPGVCVDPR